MPNVLLGDDERFQALHREGQAMLERAAETWNRIKPLYEGQEIDSIRVTAIVNAVHELAMLHPSYDRYRRRVITEGSKAAVAPPLEAWKAGFDAGIETALEASRTGQTVFTSDVDAAYSHWLAGRCTA